MYTQTVKRDPRGTEWAARTVVVAKSAVLRKDSGLPAGVLAGLIFVLLQPSAASRNRVWNPGPVSVADFPSDSLFYIENGKPERAFLDAEHPMGCDAPWLLAHP